VEETPATRLARGEKALDESRYDEAEGHLRAALSGPTRAQASLSLAKLLLLTGRHDEALAQARAAGTADAGLADRALVVGAEALRRRGRLAEAEAELEPHANAGSAPAIRLLLAELYLETGRRREAEPLLLSVVEDYNEDRIRDDDGPGLALAARAAWLLRSPRDANTLFDASERAAPGSIPVLLERAALLLEKYNPGDAEAVLEEVLAKAPRHPVALTRLAEVRLAQALDFDEAERLARAALAVDPTLGRAHFVLAGIALRDMELDEAERRVAAGLAYNPRDLELLAMRATVRFLADDHAGFAREKQAVLALNPEYARLYAVLAEYADWEHRYDEIVTLMKEALAIDDEDPTALAQLGFNLIRAGEETPGVGALSRAFALDPFNVRVYNTLHLFDTVIPKAYVTVDSPPFVIRYHTEDRAILERYVPTLLRRAWEELRAAYGFTPSVPVGIEIYAERENFAIRTSGLPHTAIQGVCFGKTLASMSPRHESFNLGMTLWHELSHVFHIQLSKSRVPRWFTEGLAEYETAIERREWTREHDPELFGMQRAGKLPSVARMSRAFTRAEDIGDVATAYYASSRIVEMLARREGRAKMAEMLRYWGEGLRTEAVFERALGKTPEGVDQEFRAELATRFARYQKQFVPIERARSLAVVTPLANASPRDVELKVELAFALARTGARDRAQKELDAALALDPKNAQARFLSARLFAEAGQPKRAEALLSAMTKDGQDGYAVQVALGELARERKDGAAARAAFERAHQHDPTQADPLIALADLAAQENQPEEELRHLERLAPLTEHAAVVHRRLLARLIERGRYADAVRAGESAVWADLNGARTHLLFAEALEKTGALDRASFELESATLARGAPDVRAEAHTRLSRLLAQRGRKREAEQHARAAEAALRERAAELTPPSDGDAP